MCLISTVVPMLNPVWEYNMSNKLYKYTDETARPYTYEHVSALLFYLCAA